MIEVRVSAAAGSSVNEIRKKPLGSNRMNPDDLLGYHHKRSAKTCQERASLEPRGLQHGLMNARCSDPICNMGIDPKKGKSKASIYKLRIIINP